LKYRQRRKILLTRPFIADSADRSESALAADDVSESLLIKWWKTATQVLSSVQNLD
jgi:hypothetical protein